MKQVFLNQENVILKKLTKTMAYVEKQTKKKYYKSRQLT